MKSLKELWEENGCKPFDAKSDPWPSNFHCVCITPKDKAIGWLVSNGDGDIFPAGAQHWTLITPKKKLYAYLLKSLAGFGDFSYEKIFFENPDLVASDLIRAPQFDLEV